MKVRAAMFQATPQEEYRIDAKRRRRKQNLRMKIAISYIVL